MNLVKAVSTAEQPHADLISGAPGFLKDFSSLINGMGEYKGGPVHIHVDEFIRPVAQPHRRMPFHVRKQVEEKLRQLESDDIIERAESEVRSLLSSAAFCSRFIEEFAMITRPVME